MADIVTVANKLNINAIWLFGCQLCCEVRLIVEGQRTYRDAKFFGSIYEIVA